MKIFKNIAIILLFAAPVFAQKPDSVRVTIDLKIVQNDRVKVTFSRLILKKIALFTL